MIGKRIERMNKTEATLILHQIEREITARFNGWDRAIKNKALPVAIQDLYYWASGLISVKMFLEELR